ncbi:hypothetical protein AAVH_22897 [Aphelenchoides avenae]|nr:hypothetical protein AAVH_22897 [Aphelenchus avenae]
MSITLNYVHQHTADEKTTVLWLQDLRLIESHVHRKKDKKKETLIAVCNPCTYNKRENAKRSIRSCSWLKGPGLPYITIMRFVFAWTRDYISLEYCQDELKLSCNSYVDLCAALREVVSWGICWMDEEPIGGPGQTVEIDETLFSRRKNHAVFVPDRAAGVLLLIIKRWIRPGTKIIRDGWKAYQGLATDHEYEWDWVNHSKNFLNQDNPEVHTQTIRVHEARLKRNDNPPLYNDSYLSEGLWRMNVKDAGQDPFVAIVNDIKAYWKPGKTEAEPFPAAEPLFPAAQWLLCVK